jgi:hypothetical protein
MSRFSSPPLRGGVAARSIKYCEATLARADGVVIKFHHFIPHHPVCGALERGLFYQCRSHPSSERRGK